MRLISDFHDYYDAALSHGHDDKVVYDRTTSTAHIRLNPDSLTWEANRAFGTGRGPRITVQDKANDRVVRPVWYDTRQDSPTHWTCHEAFVVVSGKAHPVWVRDRTVTTITGERKREPVGAPTPEGVGTLVRRASESLTTTHFRPHPPEIVVTHAKTKKIDQADVDHRRQRFLETDFTALHLELGAPVLLICAPGTVADTARGPMTDPNLVPNALVIKNPRLSDLGLQTVLDPFTCFQQISQFIEGVVPGQQMPMVEISDKSKIDKKGFDPKYGFRTRPGTK